MWGLKDAPRAFGMRLSRSLQEIGYPQGVTDRQIWRKFEKNSKPVTGDHCGFHPQMTSLISTHIDDTDVERHLLLTTLKKHYGEGANIETRNFEHTGIKRALGYWHQARGRHAPGR
eukprot:54792-Prorocentrum_lima.AAC.1